MIDAVIARLKANVPELRLVGGAAAFQQAAEKNPTALPACFVIYMEDVPGANVLADTAVQQRVEAKLGIVLVVRNVGDSAGVAAGADMEELRGLVKDQVYGWAPAETHAPFQRGHSRLMTFKDGHMWWQDLYLTEFFDRSKQYEY